MWHLPVSAAKAVEAALAGVGFQAYSQQTPSAATIRAEGMLLATRGPCKAAARPTPAWRRPAGAGCSLPNVNAKWSASEGISGQAPILGYNPTNSEACCARCAGVSGCASFTFLSRPASVGNLCYLYRAGAAIIGTLPSTFSTFKSGEGETSCANA